MLPHCGRCLLPKKNCVCAHLPSINAPFQVIIVRHKKSANKASNTAFVSSLCIPSLKIIDIDHPKEVEHKIQPSLGAMLLFPPVTSKPTADRTTIPSTLYVLDGSWKQARKMYRQNVILQMMPHLSLVPRAVPPPRILTPSSPQGMSTMEAISQSFSFFGFQEEADCIHDGLCSFIEQRRLVTGIQIPIPSGMSFSQVRKLGY
ncbi:MAG: hypothetical protein CL916_08685 [Deltaproteobacteria bacterium]|nr:hypothetical protein [Deltaproteobacteria bacterium]